MALTKLILNPRRLSGVLPTEAAERRPAARVRFAGIVWIVLAAAMAAIPLALHRPLVGDDLQFHLVSWMDAQEGWRHGVLYPQWAPSPNFGAGEPRFIFYPPLSWMLGAALGLLVPWSMVPAILCFLMLAGAGLAAHVLAREILPSPAATLAGCAAMLSGYALFTCYERAAYGELCAGVWIPLLLLFAFRDRHPEARTWRRALDGSAVPIALAVAGVWLSDAPAGVMASYLLAAVALLTAALRRSWFPILRACIAFPLGMGLSAFYVLPAAWEQGWVDILQAIGVHGDPGLRVESNWIFSRPSGEKLTMHETELHIVSLVAVSMIGVAIASFLVMWLCRRASGPQTEIGGWQRSRPLEGSQQESGSAMADLSAAIGTKCAPLSAQTDHSFFADSRDDGLDARNTHNGRASRGAWIPLACIPVAGLFLLLPISHVAWNHFPKLLFLQFPWRWLLVVEAPMGCLFAGAVWPSPRSQRWRRRAVGVLCSVVLIVITFVSAESFLRIGAAEDQLPNMVAAARVGGGLVGTDEYAYPGADNSMIAMGLPDACLVDNFDDELGKAINPEANPQWTTDQGSCYATAGATIREPQQLQVALTAPRDGFLILRLRRFPSWRVQVNGRLIENGPARVDGLIAVPVKQGRIYVLVDWKNPGDVLLGRGLSWAAVFLLLGLAWLERRAVYRPS